MTIHCLGSINLDHVHRLPHFPEPGETLQDSGYAIGLGGKGTNQAIAAHRAGGDVRLIAALGEDGGWARDRIAETGLSLAGIAQVEAATGHAVIYVDAAGENQIVIHGGANRAIPDAHIEAAIAAAAPGDWWLTQNETNGTIESTRAAKARGLRTAHVCAPFDAAAAGAILPHLDLLAVNEGEAAALAAHLGTTPEALPVPALLMTLGARGALWRAGGETVKVDAFATEVVDTTGAGDTFLGYALAGLDSGLPVSDALCRASAAAAIAVSRPGAAEAIPARADVDTYLEDHP